MADKPPTHNLTPITPTLAEIRDRIARGQFSHEERATLAWAADEVRAGREVPAATMASFLRMRPELLTAAVGLTTAFPEERPSVREKLDSDASVLLRFMAQQFEAIGRDDAEAIAWLADYSASVGRARPRDRREGQSKSKQGRPCPITDDELVRAFNQMATWCGEVLRRVHTLRRGQPLPSASDTRGGEDALAQRRTARVAAVRALALALAEADPALADDELLDEIVTKPVAKAQERAIKALRVRASGYDLASKMTKALAKARRQRSAVTADPPGQRREHESEGTEGRRLHLRQRVIDPRRLARQDPDD